MKLVSISVKNYRSLKSTPIIRLKDLSLLIGENNSGKSNLLNAIKLVLTSCPVDSEDFYDIKEKIIIDFQIKDFSPEEKEIFEDFLSGECSLNLRLQISIRESIGEEEQNTEKKFFVQTRIPTDELMKSVIEGTCNGRTIANQVKTDVRFNELIEDGDHFLKEDAVKVVRKYVSTRLNPNEFTLDYTEFQLIKQLYAIMPKFLFIPAVKEASQEIGGRSSQFQSVLGYIFGSICSDDQCDSKTGEDRKKREEIKKLCERIRECFNSPSEKLNLIKTLEKDLSGLLSEHISKTKVKLDFDTPDFENMLTCPKVLLDDGCETTIDRKGHGLQRALILAILKLYIMYVKRSEGVKKFFVCVEEPEIYLHPHSQRRMFDILNDLSSNNQTFISTHSAVLINKMSNPVNIIRLVKSDNESKIKQLADGYLSKEFLFEIAKNLNVGNSEMFFSKKTIFVEGDTERLTFPLFAKKLGVDFDDKGISVVSTNSGNNFEPFLKMVIDDGFGIPWVVVCDGDKLEVIIKTFNKLGITQESDFVGKTDLEKISILKGKSCFILNKDFETVIAKNVDIKVILECLTELIGKSITEEEVKSFGKTPQQLKDDLKNSFSNIAGKLGVKGKYPDLDAKYKTLIEELYNEANENGEFSDFKPSMVEMLSYFMKRQNKPKLGKTLGEKLSEDQIPQDIKDVIKTLGS